MIQAEKAEKAAKRAKKEELSIKQHETAEAIAEYEHSMVVNDTIENSQFPRHRDEASRFYVYAHWHSSYYISLVPF
jgi:hypothetical protein